MVVFAGFGVLWIPGLLGFWVSPLLYIYFFLSLFEGVGTDVSRGGGFRCLARRRRKRRSGAEDSGKFFLGRGICCAFLVVYVPCEG